MELSDFFTDRENGILNAIERSIAVTSQAQINRDKRAILQVLPESGEPITMADVLLHAGENLGAAMSELVTEGKVSRSMINERHAYARILPN